MRKFIAIAMFLLVGCSGVDLSPRTQVATTEESAAYLQAYDLAKRSEHVYGAVKPVVTQGIVGLVRLSRTRPLTAGEKTRLDKLDGIRKVADEWAKVHNAYLDILGAIDYFREKVDRDERDDLRLAQLMTGLPKNNRSIEGLMENVQLACAELKLDVGSF